MCNMASILILQIKVPERPHVSTEPLMCAPTLLFHAGSTPHPPQLQPSKRSDTLSEKNSKNYTCRGPTACHLDS